MKPNGVAFALALFLSAGAASAQDISGNVVIKKKLTRRSVTAPVSVYQRGTTIRLAQPAAEDPLVYERSRVVVYLEGAVAQSSAEAGPTSPAEIRQIDRHFLPDLVVVPVGSTVAFPNMDPIFHNIYSLSKAKSFDLGAYDKGETRRVYFPRPGIVEIYCHLHPNMQATVVVTPNRYYARPDKNGHYEISNVPPGHYTLVAWHKTAGFFRQSIDIQAGQSFNVDFLIPVDVDSPQEPQKDIETGRVAGLP
ncbi:MAG TPA: carboxypeptidase regulatory-like domain-containing protein [Acidobacteriaceae bacterium]|nr:carboxypeptidase regulatory-like domain-containing protein [Acidobacteriaceae bacterium]